MQRIAPHTDKHLQYEVRVKKQGRSPKINPLHQRASCSQYPGNHNCRHVYQIGGRVSHAVNMELINMSHLRLFVIVRSA